VADAVAAGDLDARAPEAETRDFDTLGARLNNMTDHLLDMRGYLVRAQQLASVGRLAAGIAHEVRNPLGAIGTYAQVLKRRGVGDAAVIDGIQREIERIDWIIRGLLDYASPSAASLEPVDPGAVAHAAFGLLQAQGTFKGAKVRLDVAPGLPTIRARAPALEQALVNLLLNAVDAAPDGEIVLTVRPGSYEPGHTLPRRTSDPRWVVFPRLPGGNPQRPEYEAGLPGVLLVVSDSGPGVPAEDRHRIFEPFFTTKAPGRGTGLGLAIVERLVDDIGGVIWVERAREGGAAFKVFVPLAGRVTAGISTDKE
jgi:signal transduction histidine kinase